MNREHSKSTEFRSKLAQARVMRMIDKLDAHILGGTLRRGLGYVDKNLDVDLSTTSQKLQFTADLFNKIWYENSIPTQSYIADVRLPRFIGGLTGRSGTGWLLGAINDNLASNHVILSEIGLFNFSQFRQAPHEYYYYAMRSNFARASYIKYFRHFITTCTYNSKKIFENAPRGLRDLLSRKALNVCLNNLEKALYSAETLPECYAAFGQFYTWLFNIQSLIRSNSLEWISKEPSYGRYSDDLFKLLPHAKLIILVRDGRDVALSMVKRGWYSDIKQAIDRWHDSTLLTLDALTGLSTEQVKIIKYEALVSNYESTLFDIFDFFELKMNHNAKRGNIWEPSAKSIKNWEKWMELQDLDYFESQCHKLMETLEYEL